MITLNHNVSTSSSKLKAFESALRVGLVKKASAIAPADPHLPRAIPIPSVGDRPIRVTRKILILRISEGYVTVIPKLPLRPIL
jgi:hypothetical protein